ncbi:MAG: AAA family ATPase [Terriglobales bacterium]
MKNRDRVQAGKKPTNEPPKATYPTKTEPYLCCVCGAPLDADGVNCSAINAPWHDETNTPPRGSMEGFFDSNHLFHSHSEALNAPPVSFLVTGFLQREGVTAIAAPVRERKSLIALNVAHALLTGQKLFDHFEVVRRPVRVIYLCPEVSLGPFMDRVKKIGLIDYVGGKFLCRTLSADGRLELDDPELQNVLPHSVVILDTAIRFLTGDENSSQDVRAFADTLFALLKHGAEAVIMLHHSPKDSGDFMSLENAMRGSGDLGALLCCCWGTKLQDPAEPYKSPSFMSNLKQRDFESQDFEVTCTPDCRMHYVDKGLTVPALAPRRTFRVNGDGRDAEAITFIRTNPKMSMREVSRALKEQGIKRSKDWVHERRYEMMQKDGGCLPDVGS